MRHRVVIAFALGAAALLVAGITTAGATERPDLTPAEVATAKFHDLAAAQAAGYAVVVQDVAGNTCIAQTGAGGMGVHYLKPDLLVGQDSIGSVDPVNPEALVYAPGPNSQLRLVALEYIVFQSVWDASHASRPELFGQTFPLTPSPNRFGIPAFYSLHAWIWKPNPSGMFQPWNPRVACP
jgi:hypothetical protein